MLAHGYAMSLSHEPPQILGCRLHRNARERYLGGTAVVAGGQRQPEDARCGLGVVIEHLIKIAHPEKQDRILMSRLDLPVLLHQRRRRTAHRSSSATNPECPCFFRRANAAAASARVS